MGDFIKELNVIDFLGIMLPGSFLLLLFGNEFEIWQLLGMYWNAEKDPNTAIRVTMLLVGGYVVGSLLHEAGDILDKLLWKHCVFDPRTYAAYAAQICTEEFIGNDSRLSVLAVKKSSLLHFICALVPLLIIWYGIFPFGCRLNDVCLTFLIPAVIFFFAGNCLVNKLHPNLDSLGRIRGADALFGAYPSQENYKIRKRMLFDGFRAMSRNLFIAFVIVKAYAQCSSEGVLVSLLLAIQGNYLYTAALFLTQALLLARYWQYSYLKYKYCYEDYKSNGVERQDGNNNL